MLRKRGGGHGYSGDGQAREMGSEGKLPNEPNFAQAGVEICQWESQKRSQIGGGDGGFNEPERTQSGLVTRAVDVWACWARENIPD